MSDDGDDLFEFAMTVGDLRRILSRYPDSHYVVVRKDDDEDSPMTFDGECLYAADSTWAGESFLTAAQRAGRDDPQEWDEAPDGARLALRFEHTY